MVAKIDHSGATKRLVLICKAQIEKFAIYFADWQCCGYFYFIFIA